MIQLYRVRTFGSSAQSNCDYILRDHEPRSLGYQGTSLQLTAAEALRVTTCMRNEPDHPSQ